LWDLVEGKLRLVGRPRTGWARTEPDVLRDLASEIEWAKASLIGPDDYAAAAEREHREPPVAPPRVAEVFRAYEQVKNAAQVLDFDDLLSAHHRDSGGT